MINFSCTSSYALFLLIVSVPALCAYQWPSPQYDALERMLYEGSDLNGFQVSAVVDTCHQVHDQRGTTSVPAQWLRFAYHDMSTHNITEGTGGLDASLYFELDRPENIGPGMSSTVNDFKRSSSKYVSRSDLIAMGMVFGVVSCGGPEVSFRGGRQDALIAGPAGVPEPQQDLATHTEKFRLQGFTQTEMIGLVACGHTLGGVLNSDFPDVLKFQGGQQVMADFDSTEAYDDTIITEYLDGTTKNPLVHPINGTFASDLRIFGSDNNSTMRSMQSPDAFAATCMKLLERMINTVPANVQLTDEIALLPQKVWRAGITVQGSQLVFDVMLRLFQINDTSIPANRVVQLFWCDARGEAKDCGSGTMNVGSSPQVTTDGITPSPVSAARNVTFLLYHFTVPISTNRSVSKFWFSVDDKNGQPASIYDNNGHGYWVDQDAVIYVPELTTTAFTNSADHLVNTVVVAGIREDINVSSAKLSMFDNTNPTQFPIPQNATVDFKRNTTGSLVDGYMYYSATFNTSIDDHFLTSGDFAVVGNDGAVYNLDYIRMPNPIFPVDKPLATLSSVSTAPLALPSQSANTTTTQTGKDTGAPSYAVRLPVPELSMAAQVGKN